ncbi:dipeptidase PepV [Thermobrachium celere]|uniref:Acetylornithine deacetylase/Succinyl-diaminopimelate desuccinylase and related deacylases n=1 Tax=Thermobrachium celere DSM 8682 TaxID=941824 RepID=R7RNX1_9CLOT|nr:dipeptidase PepV [Thermobrachium celere]CDF57754.1 Acetylornithine deacetylase/Succinyl-diaminopimelate desuccinylase and related deacylases [Thermobrachium celere DSM 8682]
MEILNKKIDELKEEIVKSTQEICRIKSVEGEPREGMPFGEGVAEALDYALKLSERLGFKTANLDGYVGYAEYGEGEDYVAVLGHLDVVPEGDGWIYPPYAAEIHDGKIYARGTMDDKGPIIAALYGLYAIKELGIKLNKRVRIIFGTNEETGSKEIGYYLSKEKPPVLGFTPDAEFPLIYAEKGLTVFDIVKDFKRKPSNIKVEYIKGGNRPNMVPDYCEAKIKGDLEYIKDVVLKHVEETGHKIEFVVEEDAMIIKSYGVSAHGSTPELGKNAVMQMINLLAKMNIEDSDVKDFIIFFDEYVGFETDGRSFGVYLEDEPSGKLSFNVGTIELNEDGVRVGLNLRYPVTFKLDDMMNPFNERIKEIGIRVENFEHQAPLYFSKEHELIKKLMKVYDDYVGKRNEPIAIGGGTYAKEMPNTVAFGPLFPGREDVVHQANEYISIEDLIACAKIYANAIYELAI